jgi:hypothetical protein
MRAVHPIFHVSMLEPATPNSIPNRNQPLPPPVEIDGEPEYEISEILNSKIDKHHRPCNVLYLVRWAGYKGTDEETSWILTYELGNTPELTSKNLDPGPHKFLSIIHIIYFHMDSSN